MSSRPNNKREVPMKQLRLCADKVIDLTRNINHIRINQKVKLQISGNLPESMLVRIEPLNALNSVKNNEALVKNGTAFFSNLRFTKSSGRGNKIDLKIYFDSNPDNILVCKKFIKITRDGPRDRKKKIISDWNSIGSAENEAASPGVDENSAENKMTKGHVKISSGNLSKWPYEKYVSDVAEFGYYLEYYNKVMGTLFNEQQLKEIVQSFSLDIFTFMTNL